MKLLGLDIGTNSVGSAGVDTDERIIKMGVGVFPAGVEESEDKRGAPKNQARRTYRGQRRSIERRAERKWQMRKFLAELSWTPTDTEMKLNPWSLRKKGLDGELTPREFGRVLLHLVQRRGAYGFNEEPEQPENTEKEEQENSKNTETKDKEAKKIKGAIDHAKEEMKNRNARTFGELMAVLYEERKTPLQKKDANGNVIKVGQAIRNRTNAAKEPTYEFCADRDLLWNEFDTLWKKQKSFNGELANQLTDPVRKKLDDNSSDATWRYKGILFGQRKTYWDMGTMGRCDLEPTDLKCPKADMYAQDYLVLETLNNIRITPPGEVSRPLNNEEKPKVFEVLKDQKTVTAATARKALGLHKGENKTLYTLSLDADPKRKLNTWWFYREIISSAISESNWEKLTSAQKDSVNKAILKFDPTSEKDKKYLAEGCKKWWGFDEKQAEKFIEAWTKRPKAEDRLEYSRRAIKNLLPYMRDGFTVNEARNLFAEDATNGATNEQRRRYSFKGGSGNHAMRRFQQKHPDLLPPAPAMLSNPVVRKAIHEVKRHIQEHIRKFGCKPDRVIVELVREARQSAVVRNKKLSENREREEEKRKIMEEFGLEQKTKNQQEKAVKRVLLCREQKEQCAYCGNGINAISEKTAAEGNGVEIDHIIPESRGGNSFLSNLLLCHTGCNRGKGNKTPKEWFTEERFQKFEQRLRHLKEKNLVKWDNLHKDAPDLDEFVASQLTDAAYAAKQVVNWLRDVLYNGERDGIKRVFTTSGRYTALLRRDWQLFPDSKKGEPFEKNRSDHRHHALDAVAIALSGPDRVQQISLLFQKLEKAEEEGKKLAERPLISPPWGNVESFRAQVMNEWRNLVVSHRPAARKIVGAFHNDTQYGPILDKDGNLTEQFTLRKFAIELTPNHLQVLKGWDELREKLKNCSSKRERKSIRLEMLKLPDVKPGKSGVIRDRWFREEIRECLRTEGLDPDNFSEKEIKKLVKEKGLFLKSGVPIRQFTLLRSPTVITIPRKQWNLSTGKMEYDPHQKAIRAYEPQNNHHIEIRENEKEKWTGEVIRNFDAAKRVNPPKSSGLKPLPAINRDDSQNGKFVMSLSIGEMVYMRHPETKVPGYFVVFKIDGTGTIHFTPHYDAGRDKETEKAKAREEVKKTGSKTGGLKPSDIQHLGIEEGQPPVKVWISPLGEVKELIRD